MRVLLTNNTLAGRAGTELYLYDVATELLRRGHHPVAFSTEIGAVAAALKAATVPVIDNLDRMGEAPDIIHGQHHFETLTASLFFPDTPVISFCHGWEPRQEEPFLSPQVLRYVAVDETCRDRLVNQFGVDPARVMTLLNFVDTEKFRPRAPLPAKPATALAFGNYFGKTRQLAAIEAACTRAGISLDVVGAGSGHAVNNPEEILARYDVVFAKARAAMEAMAVGTAVILAGPRGMGPMVSTQNCEALRRSNFGVRALSLPDTTETVLGQLSRYSAHDARQVSGWIRNEATLSETCDRLVLLYAQVIEEWRACSRTPHAAEKAAARHLNRYASIYKAYRSSHEKAQMTGQSPLAAFGALLKNAKTSPIEAGGMFRGYIESAVRLHGLLRVTGWAAHLGSGEPCAAVLAVQGEQCLAVDSVSIERPDVAAHVGDRKSASGFEFEFRADEGPVRILAATPAGEVFDLSTLSAPESRRALDGLIVVGTTAALPGSLGGVS